MNVKFVFLIIFLVFFGEICMFKLSVLSMLVELFFDVMEESRFILVFDVYDRERVFEIVECIVDYFWVIKVNWFFIIGFGLKIIIEFK